MRLSFNGAMQVAQLVVMIGGIGGLFFKVGERDAVLTETQRDLTEMKELMREVTKAQASFCVVDATHTVEIAAVRERMLDIRTQLERMGGGKP